MAPPRMTANPKRPSRYRPGKGQDHSSDSESESEQEQTAHKPQAKRKPAPPLSTDKVSGAFQEVTLNGKKLSMFAEKAQEINEDEFETESEDENQARKTISKPPRTDPAQQEDDTSQGGSEEEEDSEEEDSSDSSEDEPPAKLLRPTFIPKNKRATATTTTVEVTQSDTQAKARRNEKADAMIQAQLERNAELKALEKKAWDDSDNEGFVGQTEAEVDDTDDLDPENERKAWELRELKRIKRARDEVEQAEQEREETERRRNLSKEEREAEDAAHLAAQEEERQGKGKAGFMQRYFHKGAFFQDSVYAAEAGLQSRDIMGSRFADQVKNREVLPEFMQVRNMAQLGRRSRTKYKDLKTEDTGRWGDFGRRDGRPRENGTAGTNGRIDDTLDERFRPDDYRGEKSGPSTTGANTIAVGRNRIQERRSSPRSDRRNSRDRYRNRSSSPKDTRRKQHRSRSRERDRRKRSASPGQYHDSMKSTTSRLDKRVKVD